MVLVGGALVLVWFLARILTGSLHIPDVSEDTARQTALARVAGTVVAERYDHDARGWSYTFDIRPEGDDGKIIVVTVDADFGTIVGARAANLVAHNAR